MLPNPENVVTEAIEGSLARCIATLSILDLPSPKIRIRRRNIPRTFPASVPEATIDEDCNTALQENKIRVAW
jgi:hypothetical protein